MHKVSIPQSVIDRVVKRRGREHVFDDLTPAKTALVVVDLQNAFMLPGVSHAFVPAAPSIVPNVNKLAAAVRSAGGLVIFIQTAWVEEVDTVWSVMHNDLALPDVARNRREALARGSKGHALWSELDVQEAEGDLLVEKRMYSAFIQGSSDLDMILRQRGIDTLLITGTVTSVCCESTARDAMMRNYRVIMVSDANAAFSDHEHNAALSAFYGNFGDVMPTGMVIKCLEKNANVNGTM